MVGFASFAQRNFHAASLSALAFLLADVQGALFPFMVVFLITALHWPQTSVGFIASAAGMIGLIAHIPVGALIDGTRAKRGLIIVALGFLCVAAGILLHLPSFWPVLIAAAIMALIGAVLAPTLVALTFGVTPPDRLTQRLAHNAAFDHAGNIGSALLFGAVASLYGFKVVFWIVPVLAMLAAVVTLSIPARAIDHQRARGVSTRMQPQASLVGWRSLLQTKSFLIFTGCIVLFWLGNGPMLMLVGQKLTLGDPGRGPAWMSACIIMAQLVMLPVALWVGRTADRWGRKPLLLIAFGTLPLRGALYAFANKPGWLLAVQVFDGLGSGILSTITPLVVADLMQSNGRFNVAMGVIGTFQGIGASVAALSTGFVLAHTSGFAVAFMLCAASGLLAFTMLVYWMPETVVRLYAVPALTQSPASSHVPPVKNGGDSSCESPPF